MRHALTLSACVWRALGVACVLAVLACDAPLSTLPLDGTITIPLAEKHRGLAWAGEDEVGDGTFDPVVDASVNWIAQTPFGWQRSLQSPEIVLSTDGGIRWGETDVGLAATGALARGRGVRTMLKPHIWVSGGAWRGDLRMPDDATWQQWFDSYRTFILHYAEVAQAQGFEALCIGTELHQTVKEKPGAWRDLIRDIRDVYDGPLTYAANWWEEFEDVTFWDALDYIGVQAYFPLSTTPTADVDTMRRGWRQHLAAIERLSRRHDKPVVFTEIGYRSVAGAAVRPWEWPDPNAPAPADTRTQAACYTAFYEEVWERPWLLGVYWWKWYPDGGADSAPDDFTPQGKPATQVMSDHFARAAVAP